MEMEGDDSIQGKERPGPAGRGVLVAEGCDGDVAHRPPFGRDGRGQGEDGPAAGAQPQLTGQGGRLQEGGAHEEDAAREPAPEQEGSIAGRPERAQQEGPLPGVAARDHPRVRIVLGEALQPRCERLQAAQGKRQLRPLTGVAVLFQVMGEGVASLGDDIEGSPGPEGPGSGGEGVLRPWQPQQLQVGEGDLQGEMLDQGRGQLVGLVDDHQVAIVDEVAAGLQVLQEIGGVGERYPGLLCLAPGPQVGAARGGVAARSLAPTAQVRRAAVGAVTPSRAELTGITGEM
jgi:hypothetical protein